MSIDVHRLLWQKLNEMYGNDANSMFVLSMGKRLNYADYSPTEFPKVAGYNTFELVDSCIACNVNYAPTGSRISIQWEQLLDQGKGPKATAKQKPAFEKAKALLYKSYETREPSELYKKYIEAKCNLAKKKGKLMIECRQDYGDSWDTTYHELLSATEEYQQFEALDREITPQLQAIDEWMDGPLANVMAPMKKAFENNKRSVILPDDGKKRTYYDISMIPTNWYEWFDPDQPEDDSWINITVDPQTPDDENQSRLYKMLGGKRNAPLDFAMDQHRPVENQSIPHKMLGSTLNPPVDFVVDQHTPDKVISPKLNIPNFGSFLQVRGEDAQEKKVDIGDTQDVKIHLKVSSVQINRPWIDLSALKVQDWGIPGIRPGAWSTGVIDSSNDGSFPLLPTQMIVAKDITITASNFSKEIVDTLKSFNPSVETAELCGVFSYAPSSVHPKQSHNLRYDEKSNSILLTGTQVIGYACTLLPNYPACMK